MSKPEPLKIKGYSLNELILFKLKQIIFERKHQKYLFLDNSKSLKTKGCSRKNSNLKELYFI